MHQIRRFDDLGRISIPKEIREAVTHANNTEGVQMEVYMDEGAIVLKPHKPKDMVEVVRCERCEFWINEMYSNHLEGYCEIQERCTEYDEFCSHGTKMDGGDEE